MPEVSPPADVSAPLSRRTMLQVAAVGGAALPLLAACGGGSDSGGSDDSGSGSGGSRDSGGSGSGSGTTVAASDVPVGGGTILKADKVVVTQPSKGEFKAFSAVCTHQGCLVAKVEGGQIVCPCHGSHFSITDGSPKSGPAQSPLQAKKVSDQGGTLTVS
jgi:nitrite reductase/ring-hydroxylating ferredoxin subunit